MAGESFAEKNQAYWNQASQSVFKDKWVHDLQSQIFEFLTNNVEWIEVPKPRSEGGVADMKMMDYACGNGIVSRSLHNLFSKCIGVDLSEGMLSKYRMTANELGLTESQMMAVQGNLLAPTVETTHQPPLREEGLNGFDLVAICMALHHVDDIELATKRLAERLRPGGVLLVIDWAQDSSSGGAQQQVSSGSDHQPHHPTDIVKPNHPAAHTISHGNFSKEQILGLFQQAGCDNSSFVLADRLSEVPGARTGKMQLFFARASKL